VSVESSAATPAAAAMPSVSFKFCTAKIAGEGEDADPILPAAGSTTPPTAAIPAPGSPPGSPATWSSG